MNREKETASVGNRQSSFYYDHSDLVYSVIRTHLRKIYDTAAITKDTGVLRTNISNPMLLCSRNCPLLFARD